MAQAQAMHVKLDREILRCCVMCAETVCPLPRQHTLRRWQAEHDWLKASSAPYCRPSRSASTTTQALAKHRPHVLLVANCFPDHLKCCEFAGTVWLWRWSTAGFVSKVVWPWILYFALQSALLTFGHQRSFKSTAVGNASKSRLPHMWKEFPLGQNYAL
eukprot:1643575-Amphidinium_carterae.1